MAQQSKLDVYFEDDTVSYDLLYKDLDSIASGKLIAYFKETPHQIAFEKTFYMGEQTGVYKAYYPSGRLMIYSVYRKGKRNGDWTYYNTEGKIIQKTAYKEGQMHGYYIHKEKHFQGRYKFGKKHGKWEYNVGSAAYRKEYYNQGVLISKPSLIGQVKLRVAYGQESELQLPTGEVKIKAQVKIDTLRLPVNDSSDYKRYLIEYVEQNHSSMQVAYFQENLNQQAVVKFIVDGKINGLYKEYYPNGFIYRYIHYEAGKLEGDWKEYRPSGSLRYRGKYKNGKKHGRWLMEIGTKEFYTEKFKDGVKKN